MTEDGSPPTRLERLPTGVPGWDQVLRGDIPRGSVVLVAGAPGTGKTTLGNQLAFAHAATGATTLFATLLLINRDPDGIADLATHADGLVLLRQERAGARRLRTLEVSKLRGADHLGGRHEFAINDVGVELFPRLEAALADNPAPEEPTGGRLGFGVPGLDAMLGGGLLSGSSTLVGPEFRVPLPAVSAALDNLILLRYFEWGSRLQWLVSVLKVRETAFDPTIRDFAIGERGIPVGEPFVGAAALLTGTPVPIPPTGGGP